MSNRVANPGRARPESVRDGFPLTDPMHVHGHNIYHAEGGMMTTLSYES